MTGVIFDIKEFGVHDGSGLRTTVFLKGCPLRCAWCHNPEGLSPKPQLIIRESACCHCGLCRRECGHPDCLEYERCLHICPDGLISVTGKYITPEALVERLRRNEMFFHKNGGVTFSGGEPLMQYTFLLEVLDLIQDINAAIETSGFAEKEVFSSVISRMDFVYMDIKLADDEEHRKYTGVSNKKIIENLEALRESGIPYMIRTPLVPGITDTKENLDAICEIVGNQPHELLPYNKMAGAKYTMLSMEYKYGHL